MAHTYKYPRPMLTVDAVVFIRDKEKLKVLLIQRSQPPFKGEWAFPGGFVDMDETVEEAVVRELEEETGLKNISLRQLHTFSAVDRDPRGRTVSVVFYGFTGPENSIIRAGSDAANTCWTDIENMPQLAFDHTEIMNKALERIR
ncbi:MAG: NUDIX hydrolase [Bacteroidetes bacterium]|nr:NUDIX hydrolase [Bacteroidota bacterium]